MPSSYDSSIIDQDNMDNEYKKKKSFSKVGTGRGSLN